ELAEANREAASPLSGAWGEFGSLTDVLDQGPDQEEKRLRLRAVLRRMVEEVWCLFIGLGRWRIAAVQVFFAGGKQRSYVIRHRPAMGGGVPVSPAVNIVRSFADVAGPDDFDLRKRKDARDLENVLAGLDLAELARSTTKNC